MPSTVRTASCPSQAFPSVRFHGLTVAQLTTKGGKTYRASEGWHLELHMVAGTSVPHHAHATSSRFSFVFEAESLTYAGDEMPTTEEISGVHSVEHVREHRASR